MLMMDVEYKTKKKKRMQLLPFCCCARSSKLLYTNIITKLHTQSLSGGGGGGEGERTLRARRRERENCDRFLSRVVFFSLSQKTK